LASASFVFALISVLVLSAVNLLTFGSDEIQMAESIAARIVKRLELAG
jgi:hypothetical protein